MPSSDDDILRNGTFWQWITYKVKFGSTEGEYTGGFKVYGGIVLVAAMLGAFVFGLAF
jgi:hypothetical protein